VRRTDQERQERLDAATGWIAVHYRQPNGSDCYFGPFATDAEATQWLEEQGVDAVLIPLYRHVDWTW